MAPELADNGESALIHYLFRALYNFRERKAQSINCSPQNLLSDADLQEIAIKQPEDKRSLIYMLESEIDEDDSRLDDFLERIGKVL